MAKIKSISIHGGHGLKNFQGAFGLVSESKVDREIKNLVKKKLKKKGIKVYDATVDSGTSQTDVLKKICAKSNANDVDLTVSIHLNAGVDDLKGNGKTTGVECLVTAITGVKDKVANGICKNIAALGFKNRGVKVRDNLYFLNHTKAPAILIEAFFCDDADDVKLYKKKKNELADAIVNAIVSYK